MHNQNEITSSIEAIAWSYASQPKQLEHQNHEAIHVNHAQDGFQLIHAHGSASGITEKLLNIGLTETVVQALTAQETRPRAIDLANGIFLVLREMHAHPNNSTNIMHSLRVWCNNQFIVTTIMDYQQASATKHLFEHLNQGHNLNTTSHVLLLLLEQITEKIRDAIDQIDEELARFEQEEHLGKQANMQNELSLTRRNTIALLRHLTPQRQAIDALTQHPSLFNKKDVFKLKQLSDRVVRYIEDLELAKERASLIQEELRHISAELQNKRIYMLSIITAIFLPLSFITGLFGVNVAGIPGIESPNAFMYLIISMLGLAIAITATMYRYRWLKASE